MNPWNTRWAKGHVCCKECFSTKKKHVAKGMCSTCYGKSRKDSDANTRRKDKYLKKRYFDRFMESIRKKGKWANLAVEGKLIKFRDSNSDKVIYAPILIGKFGDEELEKLDDFKKYLKEI